MFHVEQTFYVFEIIVIVGLEGEGVFNMFSLIFLIIHEAGVEMIEIAVFVFVKAMRIDFGKPPLPLLFIEDILLNLVLREIDPLHDHVLQIGAFRVVERAFAIENNRVSIVARIERVVLPVFLHHRRGNPLFHNIKRKLDAFFLERFILHKDKDEIIE